mgnify:CR=1 FL=1
MAEEKAKKVNNASKYISKDVIVIAVVLIAIAAYIIAECYSATHVDIQTVTAVKSTVYQTLDKKLWLFVMNTRLREIQAV